MRYPDRKKGYTLVELMITLGILGIILLFMSQLLNFNIRHVKQEDMKVEYMQNARLAANYILKKVNQNNITDIQYIENGSQKIIKIAGQVVFDATKSASRPSGSPALWYYFAADYFGSGNNYGELKDVNDKTLASYIKEISVQDMSKQDVNNNSLKVVITAGKYAGDDTSLVLCLPLNASPAPAPTPTSTPTPTPAPGTTPTPAPTPSPTPGSGPTSTPSPTPVPSRLVCEYLFNNSLLDTSGNNNNGTMGGTGSISWVLGQEGNAISLDGNTYVQVADSASLSTIKSELLIDLWCYPTGFPSGSKTAALVDKKAGNGSYSAFAISINSSKVLTFEAGITSLTSTTALLSGWNHIIVSYKAGGQITVTINGILKTGMAGSNDVSGSNDVLRLGADWNVKSMFTGYLDTVRIYNSINP